MKLLLVDLSHVFWSTWHATAGQPVDTAATATLHRVDGLKAGFDRVAICCDIGPSWRKKEFPAYKAGRPERDPAAYDQLRRVRETLESEGLPVLAVEGFEADDIIATLAVKAPAAGYEVVIASGDKDLLQLVGGTVSVQSTNAGGTMMDREAVKAKFGVYPERIGDYLALVGDKSDNIEGLPGCGQVNAVRLLTEIGSLENMFLVPDSVTPEKMREKFMAARDQIKLARKLVTLSTDVPLDFEESTAPRERKTKAAPIVDGEFEEVGGEDSGGATSDAGVTTTATGSGGKEEIAPAPADRAEPPAPPRASEGSVGTPPKPAAEAVAMALVLDRQDPRWVLALEPRGPAQLLSYSQRLAESQLYRHFPNADAIMAVILMGRAMGLDMMTSLNGFHVIEGKPCPSAMLIVACVLNSGKAEYFELVEKTSTSATWETKRKGSRAVNPIRHTFSVDDAHRIGLDRPTKNGRDSNWIKYPGPMCIKQAGSELARMVYPDVVANVYNPDEIID